MNVLDLQKLPMADEDHALLSSGYSGMSLGCMLTMTHVQSDAS